MSDKKIAIGITTHQRHDTALQECLESLEKYTENKYDLVIACDSQEAFDYMMDNPAYNSDGSMSIIKGSERVGIARNKNRCIKFMLYNFDKYKHFFLLDDDCSAIKKGWDNFWINAHNQSGYGYFFFAPEEHYGKIIGVRDHGNGVVTKVHELDGGCCLSLTPDCIKAVGGMNPECGIYGGEHSLYANRIKRAGFVPTEKISVVGCEEWMSGWDYEVYYGKRPIGPPPSAEVAEQLQRNIQHGLRAHAKLVNNCPIFCEPT
jgi:GT2 family glycosyltransferase